MKTAKPILMVILAISTYSDFARTEYQTPKLESVTAIPNKTSWGDNEVILREFIMGPYDGSSFLTEGSTGECSVDRARVLPKFLKANLPRYVTAGPASSALKYAGKKNQ